ncbi:MAG: glycosyltransferase [Elusimicrobiota bacterium]|jgi:trehalose synthase|nr:glycosyltransferase [Elusimicrobiota bacterium]
MNNLKQLQTMCGIGTWELKESYKTVAGGRVNIITAGKYGSGVSEVMGRVTQYFNELGLYANWSDIQAGEEFFKLSKKITNAACLGADISLKELSRFEELSHSLELDTNYDVIYLNDHHALIAAQNGAAKKIFRAHLDVSRANPLAWDFFKPYIENCEQIIFTHPSFHKKLKGNISYICPSIDPCTVKNTFVERADALKVLKEFQIPCDKPIITQIGRFDRAKDPFGVIEVFSQVRQTIACTLILAGGHASDDPESIGLYEELLKTAAGDKDIFLLSINRQDYKIAAIQSISDVILQKSLRESFGLAITEALWKNRAVIASDVGGIPLQIKHGKTGLLCRDIKTCAQEIIKILRNKSLALRLGKNGHEFVRDNFLITTELKNHLSVFQNLL